MNKQFTFPIIIIIVAVLLMLTSSFLPYLTAVGEHAEQIEENPDYIVYDKLDYTSGDLKNISMIKITRIYDTIAQNWNGAFYQNIFKIILGLIICLPIIVLLFGIGKKPIAVILFTIGAYGVFHIQNLEYASLGIVDSNYAWGIAYYLFPAAAVIIIIVAIWMLVTKIRLKAAHKKTTSDVSAT